MGKLVYQNTEKPFRVYVYDNDTDKKIVINKIVDFETGEIFIQKMSCSDNELHILQELLQNAREVL